MRVLVTGGAGFIGSHVIDELRRRNHEPVVFDDLSSGKRGNLPDGVPLHEGDIRDNQRLSAVFDETRPDAVCHLAAQVSVSRSVREPAFDAAVNVLGTLNVLSQSARLGVKRVVFSSSGGALYGDVETPADEDHPCLPISPYGISKLTGERYLEFFADEHEMQTVAVRFSNVYGPRQDPLGEAGVVAIFATRLLNAELITVNGDGKYVRDYVEVGDVANAVVGALEADLTDPFTPFNVGSAVGTDVNELAAAMIPLCEAIRKQRGQSEPIPQPQHGPSRAGDLRSSIISHDRITAKLGWKPLSTLEDGLRRTVEWFAENSD